MNSPSAEKPYTLTFEQRPDYLHAKVDGEKDSYEISIAYWKEIAAECERRGSAKLLVEEDIVEVVSISEMYSIATELPGMFYGIAIAFVDRYADQAELNSFGEMVAQNRGVRGRFFVTVGEAKAWLASQ